MYDLLELQNELFSTPPNRVLNFGSNIDTDDGNFLEKAFAILSIPKIDADHDVPLMEQKIIARGLHPIMLVRFDFRFARDLSGEELMSILFHLEEAYEYQYWTAFGSFEQVRVIVEDSLPSLSDREGIARRNNSNDDMDYFYEVQADEQFYQLYYALTPLSSPVVTC